MIKDLTKYLGEVNPKNGGFYGGTFVDTEMTDYIARLLGIDCEYLPRQTYEYFIKSNGEKVETAIDKNFVQPHFVSFSKFNKLFTEEIHKKLEGNKLLQAMSELLRINQQYEYLIERSLKLNKKMLNEERNMNFEPADDSADMFWDGINGTPDSIENKQKEIDRIEMMFNQWNGHDKNE